MAAPFFSTPFQPYVYQSQQDTITPFQILGGESQVVQIMLKSEEKVIAKPASMCYMSGSIEMENTYTPEQEVGVLQWILGKSVSSVVLRNTGQNDGFVGIAAPYLARILPIDLAMFGGEILCQPDAFLCSVHDVKVVNSVDQRARNIVAAGAEGFLRQRLSGQGLAFILAGGSVVQKVLEVGEVFSIDVSCIAALTPSIDVRIKNNAPFRRALFGLTVSSALAAYCKVGNVAKHERESKIADTDSYICVPSIRCDFVIVDLNRSLKAER
ncbi:unnamed protein product [Arabidopsis thaliana]|uniref:Uncharacterized protein n=1 Tax=Arabidopsis thaliana TaxID=3702 RepID=Q9LVR7_ARATH|nr:unnamed protein product [Arabidopsis thaliana]